MVREIVSGTHGTQAAHRHHCGVVPFAFRAKKSSLCLHARNERSVKSRRSLEALSRWGKESEITRKLSMIVFVVPTLMSFFSIDGVL
jgi:hypothetical protein